MQNSGDARKARSLFGRLSASLHNLRYVLTLGILLLGAAILVANEAAIRKTNTAATQTVERLT